MATARMAVPMRVWLMNQYSRSISTTVPTNMTMRMSGMSTPSRLTATEGRMPFGYTWLRAP